MNRVHPVKEILTFQGFKKESYCHVSIYYLKRPFVVISEVKDGGTSAINCIEKVLLSIIQKFTLNPDKCFFVSYSPEGILGEEFNRIPFSFNGSTFQMDDTKTDSLGHWPRMSKESIEELIGQPFKL